MTSTGLHITPEEVWRWMPMGGRYTERRDRVRGRGCNRGNDDRKEAGYMEVGGERQRTEERSGLPYEAKTAQATALHYTAYQLVQRLHFTPHSPSLSLTTTHAVKPCSRTEWVTSKGSLASRSVMPLTSLASVADNGRGLNSVT
jgi:hypothetical protein